MIHFRSVSLTKAAYSRSRVSTPTLNTFNQAWLIAGLCTAIPYGLNIKAVAQVRFINKQIAYKWCFVEYEGTHQWWVNNNNNKDNKNNEIAFKSKPIADFDGT